MRVDLIIIDVWESGLWFVLQLLSKWLGYGGVQFLMINN